MEQVRQPAVAGSFYPADSGRLRAMVQDFLGGAPGTGIWPKGVIVPHAGYRYSGAVAGRAFARLGRGRGRIRRVVLLGPSHRVAFRGLALSGAGGFATPLGVVPVDLEAVAAILDPPRVHVFEPAHAHEHSLEVQLPFLQEALGEFLLVPVVVGETRTEDTAKVVERLWGGDETVLVVSSDLSHYLDYGAAQRLDRATSEAIAALDPLRVDPEGACGALPVRGFLAAARARGLRGEILDVRNSGDTAGDRDRVVGYGAYAFA